jgi:transcriptional regulator with XRE-family HTH domain
MFEITMNGSIEFAVSHADTATPEDAVKSHSVYEMVLNDVRLDMKTLTDLIYANSPKARTREKEVYPAKKEGDESQGGLLRARRIELGLTLREVADASGVSIAYVGHIERGFRKGSQTKLNAILEVLDLPTLPEKQMRREDDQYVWVSQEESDSTIVELPVTDTWVQMCAKDAAEIAEQESSYLKYLRSREPYLNADQLTTSIQK